jgi:hypothetical protein
MGLIKNAGQGITKSTTPSIWSGYIRNCKIDTCSRGVFIAYAGSINLENLFITNCSEGLFSHSSTLISVKNCIFHKISSWGVYAFRWGYQALTVENCVFDNCNRGVLIGDYGYTSHKVINSIFTNCQTGISYDYCTGIYVGFNNFFNNTSNYGSCIPDTANIYLDPLFVNAESHDFRLQSTSPCIGAGHPSIYPAFDFNDELRPLPSGSAPDMGAYEHAYGTPASIKTWNGIGDWTDEANWIPFGMPSSIDRCYINSGICNVPTSTSCGTIEVNNGAELRITEGASVF